MMRSPHLLILLPALFVAGFLHAASFTTQVPTVTYEYREDYTILALQGQQAAYQGEPGQPAIPLHAVYFELPAGKALGSVRVAPLDEKHVPLAKPPMPLQKPTPLSLLEHAAFTPAGYAGTTPASWLHGSGWSRVGGHNVGWVALASAQWNASSGELLVPSAFRVQYDLAPDLNWQPHPETSASAAVMAALGLQPREPREQPGYLLIAPAVWQDTCQPLLNWRQRQGMRTWFVSIESIESGYPGSDLQKQVRACLADYYAQHGISYVTLAADVVFIPDRKLFAFDCAYGAHDDENDLPADIYYAGLDGNWDANANGVFGEDDDEPDWLPELLVGRIPATNRVQLEGYIARLLRYERGEHSGYTHALGLAMDLWPDAQSHLAQQFIYDMYFDGWSVNFLTGDENTHDNAVAAFAGNPNLIQHTGHANYTVLSLSDGYLRIGDMNALPCDWAGAMYSIGCWSAALDYTSVGETGVVPDSGGLVGYVGNSRYGWGAPGAAAFGFSEFYQREFFRLLLSQGVHELGTLNALQKLPFVAYYPGTSVYKWCAYELNALGDAAARLFTADPLPLDVTLRVHGDTLFVQAYGGDYVGVEGAVVSVSGITATTDAQGMVAINGASSLGGALSVYAPDHATWWLTDFDARDYTMPQFTAIVTTPADGRLAQGASASIVATLANPTDEAIDFTLYPAPDTLLQVTSEAYHGTVPAGETLTLPPVEVLLRSIDEVGQMEDGRDAVVWLRAYMNNGDVLCEAPATLHAAAPALQLHAIYPQYGENEITMACVLVNRGSRAATGVQGAFSSESPYIWPPESFLISTPLQPGQFAQILRNVPVDSAAPLDHIARVELDLNCGGYAFPTAFYLPLSPTDYFTDFETAPGWEGNSEWQTVNTHAYSGTHSLSCRPAATGSYSLTTPWFPYVPGAAVSFAYRYRMPMYGTDGVYLLAEYAGDQDTLLFLGAGGALPPAGRDPEAYIESDWAPYRVRLDEALLAPPATGELVRFTLRFHAGEWTPGFNEYNAMPLIGVFLDDFAWEVDELVSVEDDDVPARLTLHAWPNPLRAGQSAAVRYSLPAAGTVELSVYNIRGQRVRILAHDVREAGQHTINWDTRDDNGNKVGSGVYLLRMKSAQGTRTGKLLLLR